MRLIDADALIAELDRKGVPCGYAKYIIENFPTPEEQKFKVDFEELIQRMRERMSEQ